MALIKTVLSGASPAEYKPKSLTVKDADTVAGNIDKITAKGGPLMDRAETRALQQMNSRGLSNSSMAVGAGQSALYDAALPIAQQDAATSFNASTLNNQTVNDASKFNAGESNKFQSQAIAGQQSLDQINRQGVLQTELQKSQFTQQDKTQERAAVLDERLSTVKAGQALDQLDRQGLIQSNLQDDKARIDREMQTADAATRSNLQSQKAAIDEKLASVQAGLSLDQIDRQGLIQSNLQADKARTDSAFQTKALQASIIQQNNAANLQALQDQKNAAYQTALTKLQGDQSKDLAEINNNYGALMERNRSASNAFISATGAIGDILSSPDIPATAKQGLVNKQIALLDVNLESVMSFASVDLSGVMGPLADPVISTNVGAAPRSVPTPTPAPAQTQVPTYVTDFNTVVNEPLIKNLPTVDNPYNNNTYRSY